MADISQMEREILGELWISNDLWENLTYLCDTCNGRFSGTDDERRAGEYLLECFRRYGLAHVHAEPFEMLGWERGEAHLILLAGDIELELPCLALPGSPGCQLDTEILDVKQGTVEDYQKLGGSAAGKIALNSADGAARSDKYQAAIEAGAAAFILNSSQPGMLPPTGSIGKDLPAISLAHESITRIQRLLATGPVRARLAITSKRYPVTARNIVAEIPGIDASAGWILVGGHYDGHDIAQGAQDNAAGTTVLVEAARLLVSYGTHLKAGIRFVLFSGEELGLHGSYDYAQKHSDELDLIRLVFNVDVVGLAMPLVLQTQASPELAAYLRSMPLKDLDAILNDSPKAFIQNSDHFPFSLAGVSAVWAVTSAAPPGTGWVHSAADTLDKLEQRTVRQSAGAVARLLLRMAAEPENLPRKRKSAEEVQRAVTEAGFEKSLRFNGRWPF